MNYIGGIYKWVWTLSLNHGNTQFMDADSKIAEIKEGIDIKYGIYAV